MRSHFTPASVGKNTMKSQFVSGAAIACAVTGAMAFMPNTGSAQIAYDTANNYVNGAGGTWTDGSTGGYGFGAWSFSGTSGAGAGQQMAYSQPGGLNMWSMFNTGPGGINDVGRSITANGGLQPGQTFQALIENPTAYHFYGGFDILFFNGTANYPAGTPGGTQPLTGIRSQVFGYYTHYPYWTVQDSNGGNQATTADSTANNGVVQIDLTLDTATSYTLTIGSAVVNGTLPSGTTINYVNFRNYRGGGSSGPNDTANNFQIQYMEIVPEPASMALPGLGLGGLLFFRRRK